MKSCLTLRYVFLRYFGQMIVVNSPLLLLQWKRLQEVGQANDLNKVHIDAGYIISSRYGAEGNQATVDVKVYNPAGVVIHEELGQSEGELTVETTGGQGPWRICFRVAKGQILRPSVMVKLTYFTVNADSMLGTAFEWEDDAHPLPLMDPSMLGSKEQIERLSQGLMRLDHYLTNVTNEQRYLYARTVRHLKTSQSTHTRAFWYSLAIFSTVALASFAQVAGVRLMFKKSRKTGLII